MKRSLQGLASCPGPPWGPVTTVFLATLSSHGPRISISISDPLGTDQGLGRARKILVPGVQGANRQRRHSAVALPGRCGARGMTLRAVSLPSWFPEADSEARILDRPVVVLLSLYLRVLRGAVSTMTVRALPFPPSWTCSPQTTDLPVCPRILRRWT